MVWFGAFCRVVLSAKRAEFFRFLHRFCQKREWGGVGIDVGKERMEKKGREGGERQVLEIKPLKSRVTFPSHSRSLLSFFKESSIAFTLARHIKSTQTVNITDHPHHSSPEQEEG